MAVSELQVSSDGRATPLTIGVSVHKDANMSDLLAALKQHPAAACTTEEQLEVGYCNGDPQHPLASVSMLSPSDITAEYYAQKGCGFVTPRKVFQRGLDTVMMCC